MNTRSRLALFAAALALAVAVAGLPAAAHAQSNVDHYRAGMPDLIDFSDSWLDEADGYLAAIVAKPELACSEDYDAFLLRGNSIVADFIGSGWDAPADLTDAHVASGQALADAYGATQLVATRCDGSLVDAARDQLNEARFDFGMRSLAIRNFLEPVFLGPELPSLPVPGPATH